MAEAHDGLGVPRKLHNLLLALAGRVDDSALSTARELIARAQLDEAAELIAGTLIAGRIPVVPAEQRELAVVLEMVRSDTALAEKMTITEYDAARPHRFTADNEPERGLYGALEQALRVLPDLRAVHAVWRNTPAGSVPGALPQRVVLIEIGGDGHAPSAAYRVDRALRKAGISAAVEVYGPGSEPCTYHHAALASANRIWFSEGGGAQSNGYGREGAAAAAARAEQPEPRFTGRDSREGDTNAAPPSPAFGADAPASLDAVTEAGPDPDPQAGPGKHETVALTRPADSEPEPAEPDTFSPFSSGSRPVFEADSDGWDPAASQDEAPEAPRQNPDVVTNELSPLEVAQLRTAIAEDPERGREIASKSLGIGDSSNLPPLNDPRLSDRDKELLRQLHAELAEREKAEAAKARTNGSQQK